LLTDRDYLNETLQLGVAGGFLTSSQKDKINKFLDEPGVNASSVLGANLHAAKSRTSLMFFLLGCADEYWDKKTKEV
jgi:hypothetical protein